MSELRERDIRVRVTQEEYDAIREAARARGLSMSNYLVACALTVDGEGGMGIHVLSNALSRPDARHSRYRRQGRVTLGYNGDGDGVRS